MIETDGRQGKEEIMKKVDAEMDDELRPEYDLKSLRVRKVGPKRKRVSLVIHRTVEPFH